MWHQRDDRVFQGATLIIKPPDVRGKGLGGGGGKQ